jgi:peptide deformylase
MTVRPIVSYPDPRLALPAEPVTVFDDRLHELAQDLLETLRAAPGIGITAPHIGISLRECSSSTPSRGRGPMSTRKS